MFCAGAQTMCLSKRRVWIDNKIIVCARADRLNRCAFVCDLNTNDIHLQFVWVGGDGGSADEIPPYCC